MKSPSDYLDLESVSDRKHEYLNGRVVAMVGASDAHVAIALNLVVLLRPHLRGTPGRLYASDMKVKVTERNCFYYPDLLVTCDEGDRQSDYFKEHPKLIIEVLSNSTEVFDRGDKFDDYSTIEELQEYVLVSQKQYRVDCFRRNQEGVWYLTRYRMGDQLTLASIDFNCDVEAVYEDVVISVRAVFKSES